MGDTVDVWADRRVKIGYETAEELAKHAHELNWRGHPEGQATATNEALDSLGWIDEIKVNINTGNVFNGHLRISLALAKDPTMPLPVDYYDLTPDEELLALQVLDATTEMAEPIADKLAALLDRTRHLTADKPGLAGMLAALRERAGVNGNGNGSGQPEPEIPTETEADKLARQYGVKVGQVWQLGRHKIIIADSTDEATRKDFISGDEYLFTDPPYGIEIDTSWLSVLHIQHGKPANLSDDKLQGDDGTLDLSFLFKFDKRLIWGFPYIFDPNATGWIVWDKQPGVSERGIVTPVELASTTLRKGFDMVRLMWGGFYRAAGEERHPHPTQKPMGVFLPFIEDWTKEGDKVLDPFLGSGTTLLCCEKLGRTCTGFDIHPPYAAVTIHRWQQLTQQQPRLVSG